MKKLIPALIPLILAACAGGGGGGGGSSGGGVSVTPFTSWSAIQPNSTVQATGGSVQVSYTSSAPTYNVNGLSLNGQSTTGASYTASYGPSGALTSFTIQSAQGATVSLSAAAGNTFASYGIADYATNGTTTEVLAINPNHPSVQWNYQSYGIWITGQGTGSGTAGAASVGSFTPVTGMPATGTATFTGFATGTYVDPSGQPFLTNANMSAATNFGTRVIGFSTSNTAASAFNGSGAVNAPLLNMSGTLSYASGSNQFSGPITTSGGMSGTASGAFYGPSANEIGGTFAVQGTGVQGMIGGFGGKR